MSSHDLATPFHRVALGLACTGTTADSALTSIPMATRWLGTAWHCPSARPFEGATDR